jgi:hypothetical protein
LNFKEPGRARKNQKEPEKPFPEGTRRKEPGGTIEVNQKDQEVTKRKRKEPEKTVKSEGTKRSQKEQEKTKMN